MSGVSASRPGRTRRLASSVWLPWTCGLLALLTVAGTVLAAGGRFERGVTVPTAVLDGQQAVTAGAAQHVRRALRAGELDLAQLADGLALGSDPAKFDSQIKHFSKRYGRYRSVYVLDAQRRVLAHAGAAAHPDQVPERPANAGSSDAVRIDKVPVVVQYAPFSYGNNDRAIAVSEYDLVKLRNAFDAVQPATAWVVDAQGEVLASTAGFTAFQPLAREELRRAARTDKPVVSLGDGSADAREIVAAAPIGGGGKNPGPSWRVVTARSVNTVLLPGTRARGQALLLAQVLAVVTLGLFGWLYVMWLRPLRRLVRDAERVADGDLRDVVEVRRYDELGLVARALERIRVGMAAEAATRSAHDRRVPAAMSRKVP
ncbi:HAMP domain-containing protein [Streptomyces sp. NPDC059161]|uniref:HAMP domain-containing protein n=1 Tax=unclassified Streptomyces TaxID=2593676 RepID=UPI00364A0E22